MLQTRTRGEEGNADSWGQRSAFGERSSDQDVIGVRKRRPQRDSAPDARGMGQGEGLLRVKVSEWALRSVQDCTTSLRHRCNGLYKVVETEGGRIHGLGKNLSSERIKGEKNKKKKKERRVRAEQRAWRRKNWVLLCVRSGACAKGTGKSA